MNPALIFGLLVVACVVASLFWPSYTYTVDIIERDDVTGDVKANWGAAIGDARRFGGDTNGVFLTYRDAKEFAYFRNHLANYGREYTYKVKRGARRA